MQLPARFGNYLLLESIGTGGMGDVFLARPLDPASGVPSPLVIKRLHEKLSRDQVFVRRFAHEAELAIAVESPHVPKLYDAGSVGGTLYLAIEHVSGWSLDRVLCDLRASGRRASLASLADLTLGILAALESLHDARNDRGEPLEIVHRDLSPKNVMIGDDGVLRLIDLGIGKSRLRSWETQAGAILGTPGYMAPEQVLARPIDRRADLYAVGLLVFEVLTLEPYIPKGELANRLMASIAPPFRAPSALREDIPSALDRVLEKTLRREVAERYPSARELAEAIARAFGEKSTRGGMETLVGEMLWSELSKAKTAISKQLAKPFRHEELAAAPKTVVFVRRPEATITAAPALDPTLPRRTSPVPRVASSKPPLRRERARHSRVTLPLTFAAMLLAGMALEHARRGWNAEPPVTNRRPPAERVVPRARALQAQPATEEQIEAEAAEPVPIAPARREKIARVHVEERPAPAAPAKAQEVSPEETIEDRLDRLKMRIHAVRRSSVEGSMRWRATDALLSDLVQIRTAREAGAQRAEAQRIATELEALEHAP